MPACPSNGCTARLLRSMTTSGPGQPARQPGTGLDLWPKCGTNRTRATIPRTRRTTGSVIACELNSLWHQSPPTTAPIIRAMTKNYSRDNESPRAPNSIHRLWSRWSAAISFPKRGSEGNLEMFHNSIRAILLLHVNFHPRTFKRPPNGDWLEYEWHFQSSRKGQSSSVSSFNRVRSFCAVKGQSASHKSIRF